MALEQGLYEYLTANLAPSLGVGQEVYWSNAPKNASFPVIVISSSHTYDAMTTAGVAPIFGRRLDIACISSVDLPSARALLYAVRNLLSGLAGALPDGTAVAGVYINGDLDAVYEVGAKSYAHGAILDVTVWCASGGTVMAQFADAEVPSGAINGTNKIFTLAHAPNPALSLELFLNVGILTQGEDYTLSGATITFANAPQTGDQLQAWYRY